jgi:ADP-ribosylation factor-like protein 3
LWDIGGSVENRAHWGSFFEQADVVVWVADTANRERLPELQTEVDRFLGIIVERFSELLILSNPIGQAICPPERLSTLFDLKSFPDLNVTILPCNPLDPSSVQRVLAWIYRRSMKAANPSE